MLVTSGWSANGRVRGGGACVNELLSELVYLVPALALAGAATGILSGLFGVGGGAVIVPALYELFRIMHVPVELAMPLCVGTSLAVIVPTSIRSYRAHSARGNADGSVLRKWILPCVVGSLTGAAIASVAPPQLFKIVFIVMASVIALRMLVGIGGLRLGDDLPRGWAMNFYGVFIGLMSALMGVGGGAMTTIIMTLHGRPIHQAVATGAGLSAMIAVPGALGYMAAGWQHMDTLPAGSIGFVSLVGAALIVPASILTAPLGVRLGSAMEKRKLEIAFGVFLLLAALRFLYSLVFGG